MSGPLPPRPPARPARRLLRCAPPRRGAGRDDDSDDIGPETTPPRGADGAKRGADETQMPGQTRDAPTRNASRLAPAPPQTAAESPREWAPALGAVKLGAGTPPSCPPAAGWPAPRSGGAWRKNAADAPQDGYHARPPSPEPAHTSPADTCQRLHNSCTTRLSEHWIPVLIGSSVRREDGVRSFVMHTEG